ncbi:MAG: hypothetical protein L0Z50_37910 [Verrucomicrobiales bacterium]|nr:hypothetical protein [Verrucomicrobiales bacterium]
MKTPFLPTVRLAGRQAASRLCWAGTLSIMLLAGVARSQPTKTSALSDELPARYFRLIEAELALIEKRLDADPQGTPLRLGECPGVVLAAAVLYATPHPANPSFGDARKLALAQRIGDLLADGFERGEFQKILNDDWGSYMWLDAFRLTEKNLGAERAARWRKELQRDIQRLFDKTAECIDFPRYQAPFIRTSSNHFSLWASTLHLAGKLFHNQEWENLGARAMHRLAAEEQTLDGFWGENSDRGPEPAYNYVTTTGVALYWEHSRDAAALDALRRATDFHKFFTWPDGNPVETIDDRNRHTGVHEWGHFGFSHFPEGRRYAEFLTAFFREGKLSEKGTSVAQRLGRIAQNALYYHEGPTAPIPQDLPRYAHQMKVPAGIRKSGPWMVCLSGLTDTPVDSNQFFLDRQGHLSIFHERHERLSLIVTGANSKRQPELATFTEKLNDRTYHFPVGSRLQMSDVADRLSLAYNKFFAVLEVLPATETRQLFRFLITPTGRMDGAELHLQLVLKFGVEIETAAGRKASLDDKPIRWSSEELGGWIRHLGWTLKVPPGARLTWPVYPFNPYRNGPETELAHAVGTISFPLTGKQELGFAIESN